MMQNTVLLRELPHGGGRPGRDGAQERRVREPQLRDRPRRAGQLLRREVRDAAHLWAALLV